MPRNARGIASATHDLQGPAAAPSRLVDASNVLEELGVQIDLLDQQGGQYARQYLAHELGGQRRPPMKPRGMHHLIAQALRDIARDEATAVRLYGRRIARDEATAVRLYGRRVTPGQSLRAS
jgi:hypothetical protein